MQTLVICGTGTGVGKTVFAAALVAALDASYWKPVQAGLDSETDSATVARLSGQPPHKILAETYRLALPASPHAAADADGIAIDPRRLVPPPVTGPLVIETAGGLLVPLTHDVLQIDVIRTWRAPIILVAPTTLGTINHSLLSLEALRHRDMSVSGIVFTGDANPQTEAAICKLGAVRHLGRLPPIPRLTQQTLGSAFAANFHRHDFQPEVPAS